MIPELVVRLIPGTLAFRAVLVAAVIACTGFGQTPLADVRISTEPYTAGMTFTPLGPGRFQISNATLLDLTRLAYDIIPERILGGPNWLALDRFTVSLRYRNDNPAESRVLMPTGLKDALKAVLADRFALQVRNDSRPIQAWVLAAGKKPLLKEGDGTGDTGCHAQSAPAGEGSITLHGSFEGGNTVTVLGPDRLVTYTCRNMTMEAFAALLPRMSGVSIGQNPAVDLTDLKGAWNFSVKWSYDAGPASAAAEKITPFAAIDKQLGLKLEQRQVPAPVLIVDGALRTPTPNPAGVTEAFPPIRQPKEFDVADVKPTPADFKGGGFRMEPGGRLVAEGVSLNFLLIRAFNVLFYDEIAGMPPGAEAARVNISAKLPAGPDVVLNPTTAATPLLSLLETRFGLKYHREDQLRSAYTMIADRPTLKPADPSERTSCGLVNPKPPGTPLNSMVFRCQNATLGLFAERFWRMLPGNAWPVEDATGIAGDWDFSLTFSMSGGSSPAKAGPATEAPAASDPSAELTLIEALPKQLGLKLVSRKRPMPVIVIDHLDLKPTDN